jgi:hypothetical protein
MREIRGGVFQGRFHNLLILTQQRYLIEYFAQPPSSMRDIGTVMAPLHVSH